MENKWCVPTVFGTQKQSEHQVHRTIFPAVWWIGWQRGYSSERTIISNLWSLNLREIINNTRLYHVFLRFIIYYYFQSKENNSVIKSFKGSNVKVSSIFQQLLFNNGDGGTPAVKFRSGEKIFLFISWVHKDQRGRGGEYMQFSSGRLCLR